MDRILWVGSSAFGQGSLHVVPASGGTSRILHDTLQALSHPVWDPASKHILVLGSFTSPVADWVVVPFDGGPVVETGVRKYLESAGITGKEQPLPDAWEEDEVFFTSRPSLTYSSSRPDDLWKIRLQPPSWSPTKVERLTQGSGQNAGIAIAANGRVVFSGLRWSRGLFELGSGTLTRISAGTGTETFPSLSAKGDRLVFVSDRSGSTEVWQRDTKTGTEEMLTEGKEIIGFPRVSPDGKKVAYSISRPPRTFVMGTSGRWKEDRPSNS